MMRYGLLFMALLSVSSLLFAQESGIGIQSGLIASEQRIQLARSADDYPVTPGDVYALSYYPPGGFTVLEVVIRSDFTASVGVFGSYTVKDLTALQFAKTVEERVQKAYPDGRAQLLLKSAGIFTVYLKGEVFSEKRIECWGLSTLNEVLSGRLTAAASIRSVEILARSGTTKTCDLFRSVRAGTREGNPYLRPGDVVTVKKAQASITIRGEVFRPGTYEILATETLRDLVETFAGGITPAGDPTRVYVRRFLGAAGMEGEAFMFDAATGAFGEFKPMNLDQVVIPVLAQSYPTVVFEGAIRNPAAAATDSRLAAGRYVHTLVSGERLTAAFYEVEPLLTPGADLAHAYLVRDAQAKVIAVNIEALLEDYSVEKDVVLEPGDRVIIPIREFFVTISGAVLAPGRYP